ncbi:hypothetical protein [Spirulina sp. 06S082]|uniref:hypothetical protein n=1 Tax=Spirulina sp. 06S082 TaxID=3110248 RepID=UPI002B1FE332|nr:hypothetical protein [Spirulina sp. 06S082]MEA5471778.1 hypothetical protein [Spirulina sp. 06S082]
MTQLQQHTRASESQCRNVATRITDEVQRICDRSQRIQASAEIENEAKELANKRLQQCLYYFKLGSHQGKVKLHTLLTRIVYNHIFSSYGSNTRQARLDRVDDFLQGFYVEALNNFRKEAKLSLTYSPRSLLELSEYLAFCQRYARRRIPLPSHRSQQLIILRAWTFAQDNPPEIFVDIDSVAEGNSFEAGDRRDPIMQQLRSLLVSTANNLPDTNLYDTIVEEVINYLESRKQQDCADYFILRLEDLTAGEIEHLLEINSQKRDYLQQRFKYHLIRFTFLDRWKLVHQWLEADLDRNLGLTPQEWQSLQNQLTPQQNQILQLQREEMAISAIAIEVSLTPKQTQKQWYKVLKLAWEIRNHSLS